MSHELQTTAPVDLATFFGSAAVESVPRIGEAKTYRAPLIVTGKDDINKVGILAVDFQDDGPKHLLGSSALMALVGEGYETRGAYRKDPAGGQDILFCKAVNNRPTAENPCASSCFDCPYAKFDNNTNKPWRDDQGGNCRPKMHLPAILVDATKEPGRQTFLAFLICPPTSKKMVRAYVTGIKNRAAFEGRKPEEMLTRVTATLTKGDAFEYSVLSFTPVDSVTNVLTDPVAQQGFMRAYMDIVEMMKDPRLLPGEVDDVSASKGIEAQIIDDAGIPQPVPQRAAGAATRTTTRKPKPGTDAADDDPDKMGDGVDENGDPLPF